MATSGGVDSTSLLHYLKTHEKKFGYRVSAVHCEHGIRGEESVADWKFVEKLCQDWEIPLFSFSENCIEKAKKEKISLETAARNFRYACFSTLVAEDKTDYVATAHHLGDEAETVLFRLARGTALSGVKGIEAEKDWLIRPFLDWTREEIEEYARQNHLQYCVDKTNFECDATRNKLRLEVLPKLENAVSGATRNLARFAQVAAEDDALLYEYSKALISELNEGGMVAFSDKKPLFSRACLTVMKGLGIEKDYTATHVIALFDLQFSERGCTLDLPKNVMAEKRENGILFYVKKEFNYPPLGEEKIVDKNGFDGGRYAVNIYFSPIETKNNGLKILRCDWEQIPKNAAFRFRKEGEWIQRFGGGKKSLKKFFNEEKTPVKQRGFLPLIADAEGEVYAVCGVEISEKIKVTENTKQIAYIVVEEK